MVLTFLNLVVASGILVGSIEGAILAVQKHYLGDIFISTLTQKAYIERTNDIISAAKNLPGVESVSARYIAPGTLQADYKKSKKPSDLSDQVSASFAGIDPTNENAVSDLSSLVVEGSYLQEGDYDQVLLGGMLLKRYNSFESSSFPVLPDVQIGDRVLVTINGNSREVIVKGIVFSKVDEIDRRVFFVDSQLRKFINRFDYNADEIAIRLTSGTDPISIKNALLADGFGSFARIQTQQDAEPKFIKDLRDTFAILGNVISSIGLVVTAITIFIVIFINAITRRKYIGILKSIGMHSRAIEFSYIFQSIFYALVGSTIGLAITYGFLVPFFTQNPIDFPFGDGILVAPIEGTLLRVLVLMIATIVAGYVPARIIIKRNTLDAILGR